jgi:nitrite reductase (NADH) small subunit
MNWIQICPYPRLEAERGVAALVGEYQVALFRLHDGRVYAISNHDPVSGAAVLAHGIVGTRGDIPILASPMHKQVYDLRTGECLDRRGADVPVYPVRLDGETVEVAVEVAGGTDEVAETVEAVVESVLVGGRRG